MSDKQDLLLLLAEQQERIVEMERRLSRLAKLVTGFLRQEDWVRDKIAEKMQGNGR